VGFALLRAARSRCVIARRRIGITRHMMRALLEAYNDRIEKHDTFPDEVRSF